MVSSFRCHSMRTRSISFTVDANTNLTGNGTLECLRGI
jgi:hypothetical protein